MINYEQSYFCNETLFSRSVRECLSSLIQGLITQDEYFTMINEKRSIIEGYLCRIEEDQEFMDSDIGRSLQEAFSMYYYAVECLYNMSLDEAENALGLADFKLNETERFIEGESSDTLLAVA